MALEKKNVPGVPKKDFGIPGKDRFQMGDAKHQRLAIGGATRSYNAGNISKATEERIKAEARRKLGIGKNRGLYDSE